MKKYFILLLFFVLTTGCATSGVTNKISLPAHKDFTLKNGLKVLLIEDHSLPYVNVGLLIRHGASQDSLGKSGLANMVAEMLERGTKNKTATQIADAFGQMGTEFSSSVDNDYSYFSTSGLSLQQNELLNLFFEVITKPVFSNAEIHRLKSEMIASIKNSYDQPSVVAGLAFNQMLYGVHPYGRSIYGSVRDVKSINQKDIIKLYLQSYRPNNSILVLVGDFNKDIIKNVETALADWQPREIENAKLAILPTVKGVELRLINRNDLKQSEIRIGHLGIKRNNEDYQALGIAEIILGGGFTSRLMSEVRVKRGLTYGISANFDAREDIGPFDIATNTRHEKVGEVIQTVFDVYKKFYQKGVTEEEVDDAKNYLRGVFPRRIETPGQMARMLVALRFYGVSDNYLFNYLNNLDKISASDVNKVIKKYFHPDDLKVLVYGPKDKIIDQLRPVGTVQIRNYRELL